MDASIRNNHYGGGTVTFKYDPFGRRIYKSSPAGTSIFAYDGDNLVEETNASGTAVARYSQGLNIDEPLAMLRGGAASFYHADGLGSVTSLSNATGSIANTYTYDSFGKLTASTGSLVNPFQYTARESDAETGLYYYRARYYDQNAGRFISEDPIQFIAGENFYVYVRNQATNLTDPRGLQQDDHPFFKCTCTRAIVKPVPFKPNSKISLCQYSCDCIGGKFIVLFSRIQRLKGCKDIQNCPYQIGAIVDPLSDSLTLIPDPSKPPVLEPPKK